MWGSAPKWVQIGIITAVVLFVIVLLLTWLIGASKHDNEERPEDKS